MVYDSDAMHELLVTATQVAPAEVPVLITGPNGAGKEVVADIIQANSACADGPFIKVNVGALPGELMESELFGAEAGLIPERRRRARDASRPLMAALCFWMRSATSPSLARRSSCVYCKPANSNASGRASRAACEFACCSATNADLRGAIREGRFREDLFYRLNVIELKVPSLAARLDDVVPLARHFLEPGFILDESAVKALRNYSWPGNIRELANVIRRACLLTSDRVIRAATLALPEHDVEAGPVEREPDRQDIEQALQRSSGVVAQAARDLGLSRQALYRRMEKLGIR